MPKTITIIGSLNMDLVVRSARLPKPGETLLGGDFVTTPGGKGANQALAAARLGGKVRMIGRVGEDDFGSALIENLQADGVDTSQVLRTACSATGVALITIDNRGENTIIVASGANSKLVASDLNLDNGSDNGVVVLQLEIPIETVAAGVRQARRAGRTVVVNPAPAHELPDSLLADVDFIIPNETEAALLSGFMNPVQACMALSSKVRQGAIITLGSQGLILRMKNGEIRRLPAFAVMAIDTVAAGDAFVGAFADALSENRDPFDAAGFASAAAAIAVTRSGAQTSLPHRDEVQAFLDTHPYQFLSV